MKTLKFPHANTFLLYGSYKNSIRQQMSDQENCAKGVRTLSIIIHLYNPNLPSLS